MNPRIVISLPWPRYAQRWHAHLAAQLPGADIVLDDGSRREADFAVGVRPPADFFERVTGLQAFFGAAAGVDALLEHPAMPTALPIVRLEDGGMAAQLAEYCCAELFRYAQRRALYEQQQADGIWKQRGVIARRDITVGLFGIGVLGKHIADTVRRFGYPVIAAAGSSRREGDIEVFGPERRDEFFARTRVLILIAPLTPATRGVVNRDALARMPAGGWLINIARGALVVEDELLAALDSGHLAGASLDVFETEPLPAEHRFWTHPAVRMTPHVAGVTLPDEASRQVAAKMKQWMAGEPVSGVIERGRGY